MDDRTLYSGKLIDNVVASLPRGFSATVPKILPKYN